MSAGRPNPTALASVLSVALLTAGCKSLTADGGMAFVESVAGNELRKDVVAIRSPAQAEEAQARVAALLRQPLNCGIRRADRFAQQSRSAGGFQRARHCGSRNGPGASAAVTGDFA